VLGVEWTKAVPIANVGGSGGWEGTPFTLTSMSRRRTPAPHAVIPSPLFGRRICIGPRSSKGGRPMKPVVDERHQVLTIENEPQPSASLSIGKPVKRDVPGLPRSLHPW
jgi:hypothetical protein